MNFHRESRRESYDVIIIGAGVGGLVAGALLAKSGRSVLLIERHDRPGGYMHGFSRRGMRFDSGVHLVGGCSPTSPDHRRIMAMLLECLQLQSKVTFERVDPFAHVFFPQLEIALPQGMAALEARLLESFPDQRPALHRFLTLTEQLAEEASRLAAGESLEPLLMHRYQFATLAQVLDDYLDDAGLKAVLAGLWPYLGLPPGQLSYLYWSLMFVSYVCDGAGFCRGTFQQLADAWAGAIEAAGGELLFRLGVRRILLEQGRAAGVVTDNGQSIRAPVVIANVDLLQTFEQLLPADLVPPRYLKKLRRLQPSLSALVVYLATDRAMDDAAWHESFHYQHFDHERHFRATQVGEISWFSITHPSHTDPALAPEGVNLLMLTTLARHDLELSWRQAKDPCCQRLLDLAEQKLPGLQDHLLLVEAGSPRTLARYTLNHNGAAYGWAPLPEQVGPARPAVKSPVSGLFLAGHWSSPGGGVYGAALSGIMATLAILEMPDQESLWRRLCNL